jgi:hypothetical protein
MDIGGIATIALLAVLGYFAYRRIKHGPEKGSATGSEEPETFRDHWVDNND